MLSMNYMILYPGSTFRCIRQMIDSVANNTSELNDNAEEHFSTPILGKMNESVVSSAAEDLGAREDFLAEVNQITSQVAIVALNTLVEVTLKKVLTDIFKLKVSRMNFEEIKSAFESIQIQLDSMDKFAEIDEIRLVANSIKHGGIVSEKLAAANGKWYPEVGKEIHIKYSALDQYYSHTQRFLDGVFEQACK